MVAHVQAIGIWPADNIDYFSVSTHLSGGGCYSAFKASGFDLGSRLHYVPQVHLEHLRSNGTPIPASQVLKLTQ